MPFVFCSAFKPSLQQLDLFLCQRFVVVRGRHQVVLVFRRNSISQFGQVNICDAIESQIGLSCLLIRSMTGIAVIGKDRSDIPAK